MCYLSHSLVVYPCNKSVCRWCMISRLYPLLCVNSQGCLAVFRDPRKRFGHALISYGHLLSEHNKTGVTNSDALMFFPLRSKQIVNRCSMDFALVEKEGHFLHLYFKFRGTCVRSDGHLADVNSLLYFPPGLGRESEKISRLRRSAAHSEAPTRIPRTLPPQVKASISPHHLPGASISEL